MIPFGVLFAVYCTGINKINSQNPSLYKGTVMLILNMILADIVFYSAHRLFHTKYLYKYIHSQHHIYKITFA